MRGDTQGVVDVWSWLLIKKSPDLQEGESGEPGK